MPQRPKGPHLWLRPARVDRGARRPAAWYIRDGRHLESTGCFGPDTGRAADALAAYLNRKHVTEAATGSRRPDQIPVADVLAVYARDRLPHTADPLEGSRRLEVLGKHMGSKMLSELTAETCRGYATKRGHTQGARRELEDLRAAINHHRRERLCSEVVTITLPEKSQPRELFLTRSEAARAIWAAWRYREQQNRRGTDRKTRQHIARLILTGIYSGSRPGTLIPAALQPEPGRPWYDTERGVFYRNPSGRRVTKKRQPPAPIADRLLAHLRRWKRLGMSYVVEFNGKPVSEVRHAFAAVMKDAGLNEAVTPHVLRHTAVTWAMLEGADLYQAGKYFGLTVETLERVYGHHHPEHLAGVKQVLNKAGRVTATANASPTLHGNASRTQPKLSAEKTRKAANG